METLITLFNLVPLETGINTSPPVHIASKSLPKLSFSSIEIRTQFNIYIHWHPSLPVYLLMFPPLRFSQTTPLVSLKITHTFTPDTTLLKVQGCSVHVTTLTHPTTSHKMFTKLAANSRHDTPNHQPLLLTNPIILRLVTFTLNYSEAAQNHSR